MGDRWTPSAALRPHVASMVAYDLAMPGPGVHVGMPSTSLTFVLPVGEPLDVGWSGVPGSRRLRWSTVSGLHTTPAVIHHGPRQAGVQLGLTPLGARTLLGLPAAALAGEIATLEEAAPGLCDLPDRLAAVGDWSARLALLERRLLDVLARSDASMRADVGHALATLTRGVGVQRTAEQVGLGRRHLGTLVRAECGVSPKQLHRIARLERSRSALVSAARAGRPSLAVVAANCGYADQAHLTREWRALAGCTPSAWMREELPFVQDVGDPGVGA
jgi:AraC-like DNA-binding protein